MFETITFEWKMYYVLLIAGYVFFVFALYWAIETEYGEAIIKFKKKRRAEKMNRKLISVLAIGIIFVMIFSVFAMITQVVSAQETNATKNWGTNTNITFTPAWNNPVFPTYVCETTLIYNSTANWNDAWTASGSTYGGGGFTNLWYSHTTNANKTIYTTPVKIMTDIRFPFIVKDTLGVFYCFAHNSSENQVGNLYMWTSHDKLNWTLANGGIPVLYGSLNGNDIHQWMANPTVVIEGNMFYLWIECANNSIISDTHGFGIGYSYSEISSSVNFTRNATETQVIEGGGSQSAYYVQDRNAFMIFWHKHSGTPFASIAKIVVSTVNISSNLSMKSSYTESTAISIGLNTQYSADFTMAITPTELVMQFFHDQPNTEDIYQMNCSLTLNELLDQVRGYFPSIPTPPTPSEPPTIILVGLLLVVGTIEAGLLLMYYYQEEKFSIYGVFILMISIFIAIVMIPIGYVLLG